jgi:hypothetical protein
MTNSDKSPVLKTVCLSVLSFFRIDPSKVSWERSVVDGTRKEIVQQIEDVASIVSPVDWKSVSKLIGMTKITFNIQSHPIDSPFRSAESPCCIASHAQISSTNSPEGVLSTESMVGSQVYTVDVIAMLLVNSEKRDLAYLLRKPIGMCKE